MFKQAQNLDPNHVASSYHLGLMYHKTGLYPQALKEFSKVLSIVGKNRLLYESRGKLYQDMRNHKAAIQDFVNALNLDPFVYTPYIYRGISYVELKEPSQAISDF